jgi:hypothetical protein
MASDTDYEQVYTGHWRKLVEQPDGTLNLDQVKRELADYWMLLGMVAEAYDGVTGGRISKQMTMPVHVIDAVEERISDAERETVRELITSLEGIPERSFATVADVVELVRELAGVQVDGR